LKNINIIQQISSLHGKAITWQYRRVNMQIENLKVGKCIKIFNKVDI